MIRTEVTVPVDLTPELLALAFWNMDSEKQADFYAHLHRIADGKLCQQTAWIVREIAERHARGERDAREGFGILHSHADEYLPVYVDALVRART